MSYVTYDRYGNHKTNYSSMKSREAVGTGNTWWPDFGPGLRDSSFQHKSATHHHIFEKVVKPHTTGRARSETGDTRPVATQFRHPAPAREAMVSKAPEAVPPNREERLAAHNFFQKKASLQRLEVRQKRMDSWIEAAPIRMTLPEKDTKAAMRAALTIQDSKAPSRSQSEPSLSMEAGNEVTREVYERLGYLVGRSKGSPADGLNGSRLRRHNPLSFNALMFGGGMVDSKRSRAAQPRKPSKQWRMCPESSFVFDPRTSLPVPRGGWDSQPPSSWPEPPGLGHREWSAPVTFDARPQASIGGTGTWAAHEARSEYARSSGPLERDVAAGQAGTSVPKLAYSGSQSFGATSSSMPAAAATETQ